MARSTEVQAHGLWYCCCAAWTQSSSAWRFIARLCAAVHAAEACGWGAAAWAGAGCLHVHIISDKTVHATLACAAADCKLARQAGRLAAGMGARAQASCRGGTHQRAQGGPRCRLGDEAVQPKWIRCLCRFRLLRSVGARWWGNSLWLLSALGSCCQVLCRGLGGCLPRSCCAPWQLCCLLARRLTSGWSASRPAALASPALLLGLHTRALPWCGRSLDVPAGHTPARLLCTLAVGPHLHLGKGSVVGGSCRWQVADAVLDAAQRLHPQLGLRPAHAASATLCSAGDAPC